MSCKIFVHRRARKLRPASPPVIAPDDPERRRDRAAAERRERQRIEAARQARRAAAREYKARLDAMLAKAKAAFPWDRLGGEIRIFDRIARLSAEVPVDQRVAARASYFALHLVFGPESYEFLSSVAPGKMNPETWEIIEALCPITTNREHIRKITDFLAHYFGDKAEFREIAEKAAEDNRLRVAERIEAARDDKTFVTCCSIGDDWYLTRTERVDRLVWRRMGRPFGSYEAAFALGRKMRTPPSGSAPQKRRLVAFNRP